MDLETLITAARQAGASDLHLEPSMPMALRVRGALRTSGEPMAGRVLLDLAREVVGADAWPEFLERRSYDLSKTIAGVRCRINVLQTSRGVGMAIRLLASFTATLEKLNLLPDLRRLLAKDHGLILLSGATGSGKSTTLAAFIQELNLSECKHIVTIESPIEYAFRPRQAFIRQREVGRDTPSFEQALLDSLREDPDVLMVGEVRDPETMRLTLNASETGHLVLTTVHSGTCVEALQRMVSAFPGDMQNNVRTQLADVLVAVVAQRLRYRPDLKILVPECEILIPTYAVRSAIRSGDLAKIIQMIETGAEHGMWTWARYQGWLESRKQWSMPVADEAPDSDPASSSRTSDSRLPSLPSNVPKISSTSANNPARASQSSKTGISANPSAPIEIEPVEGGLDEVIRKLEG